MSESNVADHSSRHNKGFLAKRNRRSLGKVSLLSAPGNVLVKTTLTKSLAEGLWYTQTEFLSKQGLTIVTGRQRDALTIQVPGTYTLLR